MTTEKANETAADTSSEKWKHLLQDCRASGQSIRAWCRTHCIDVSTFYRHRRALEKADQKGEVPTKPLFCELELESDVTEPKPIPVASLYSGTIRVELYACADEAFLRNLFSVIRTC